MDGEEPHQGFLPARGGGEPLPRYQERAAGKTDVQQTRLWCFIQQ